MVEQRNDVEVVSTAASRDKAFEIFVKRTISSIQKDANGRSREAKELRDACISFLTTLEQQGCTEETLNKILHPLQLASASSNPKVVDLALGCLHKLVAHAWIHGESSSHSLEVDDKVAQVIRIVIKCGDSSNEDLQLSVIRALLTFTTAEHFIAHGDCLLAAIRTVFNLALGSEDQNIKRTACNALLQMLNTVMKRVTMYQPRITSSNSSRAGSCTMELLKSPSTAFSLYNGTQTPVELASTPRAVDKSPGHTGFPDMVQQEEEVDEEQEQRAAELASLAEQQNLEGLEAALEVMVSQDEESSGEIDSEELSSTPRIGSEPPEDQTSGSLPPTPAHRSSSLRSHRSTRLTTAEKDVLQVLTAFCKLASRDGGTSSAEPFLHQGKLLALELLVKVVQNPQHCWDHVRETFCRHLRQPLCLALIKNCAATDPVAQQLTIKLLAAIMCLPRLRHGLRAELGALYPMLFLKHLEQGQLVQYDTLLTVLNSMKQICSEAQLVVDIFVNYDCDLHAANLYERTMSALSRWACLRVSEGGAPEAKANKERGVELAQQATAVASTALKCIMLVTSAMDAWAGPIRDSARCATPDNDEELPAESPTEPGSVPPSEVERFSAAKSHKASFTKALTMFNTKDPLKGIGYLISQGLVEGTPQGVAQFIRDNAAVLDKGMIGEYFGHHDDFQVQVMHAYIDQEVFSGHMIDLALRQLLARFRLPGEAQKIDRIMEKFAERYCKDNPAKFRNADAAYMLSFAIIMLNTDAHNPMAERRLGRADFVSMNYQQTEESMEPVLPVGELEGIYDRIVNQEIMLSESSATGHPGQAKSQAALRLHRLAAALGIVQLAQPFTAGWGRGNNRTPQGKDSQGWEEKPAIPHVGAKNIWHTATHAEHTRPMLSLSGEGFCSALADALHGEVDPRAIEPLLSSLVVVVRLACLLGLDDLCERGAAILAQNCGLLHPATPGSAMENKQLMTLKALMSLAVGPEAGQLGSSWPSILRCISTLEGLQVRAARSGSPTKASRALPRPENGSGGLHLPQGNPLHRMLQTLGINVGGQKGAHSPKAQVSSAAQIGVAQDGSTVEAQESHPSALVSWFETEGQMVVERICTQSSAMDGDAVVVFMRALCAVSQEELDTPGAPRLFSLQKVVECAYVNMGRIRLVWSKLWSVISTHLVGASCHVDSHVAMYAVDSLRQLIAKLLSRAELANFTHQEEALRPFVLVLRQCDDVGVRELTIQCLMQAITAHARGLGSGWRMVVEALRIGVADPYPSVMVQAVKVLQVVIDALYRGPLPGHECLHECVRAVMDGVNNPHHLDLSCASVQLLIRCARRLAERNLSLHKSVTEREEALVASASGEVEKQGLDKDTTLEASSSRQQESEWVVLLRPLSDIILYDQRPMVVSTSMEVVFLMMQDFSAHWDDACWAIMMNKVVPHVFRVPPEVSNICEHQLGSMSPELLADHHHTQQAVLNRKPAPHLPLPPTPDSAAQNLNLRMDHFAPTLCRQYSALHPPLNTNLVCQLSSITAAWMKQEGEVLAVAGLKSWLKVMKLLAPALDTSAWLQALQPVRELIDHEVTYLSVEWPQVMSSASSRQSSYSFAQSPQTQGVSSTRGSEMGPDGSWGPVLPQASGGPGVLADDSDPQLLFRARCRLLVLLQKALDSLHSQGGVNMSEEVQVRLLEILHTTVRAAMAVNQKEAAVQEQQSQPGLLQSVGPRPHPQLDSQPSPSKRHENNRLDSSVGADHACITKGLDRVHDTETIKAAEEAEQTHQTAAQPSHASNPPDHGPGTQHSDDDGHWGSASGHDTDATEGGREPLEKSEDEGAETRLAHAAPSTQVENRGTSGDTEDRAQLLTFSASARLDTMAGKAEGSSSNEAVNTDAAEKSEAAAHPHQGELPPKLPPVKTNPAQGLVASTSAHPPPTSYDGPLLVGASRETTAPLTPAMMRLETEGGLLLLSGLLRGLQRHEGTLPHDGLDIRRDNPFLTQLVALCRDIICCAAQSSGANSGPRPDVSDPWQHAVRAPLVVEALRTLQVLMRKGDGELLHEVFPHLAHLICSRQAMVREAVYQVLSHAYL